MSLVDRIEVVDDKESFLTARRMTREEGILIGGSGGSAVAAAAARRARARRPRRADGRTLLPDSGRNYLSKIFNEDWMRSNGFLEQFPTHSVGEMVGGRGDARGLPNSSVCKPATACAPRSIPCSSTASVSCPCSKVMEASRKWSVRSRSGRYSTASIAIRRWSTRPSARRWIRPFPRSRALPTWTTRSTCCSAGLPHWSWSIASSHVGMITKLDLLEFVAQHDPRRHKHR